MRPYQASRRHRCARREPALALPTPLSIFRACVALSALTPGALAAVNGVPILGDVVSSAAPAPAGDASTYIIASFPQLKEVQYARLPSASAAEATAPRASFVGGSVGRLLRRSRQRETPPAAAVVNWRPLVAGGLVSPGAVAIDGAHARLYVADASESKIFWYKIQVLPTGEIAVEGEQQVLMDMITARGIAADGSGLLYVAGHKLIPVPGVTEEAILKIDPFADPTPKLTSLWTRNTSTTALAAPRLWIPSAVAVDAMHVFWTNSRNGGTSGSVVRAGLEAPTLEAERAKALTALATNAEAVRSVALTGQATFYGVAGGVYGVGSTSSGTSRCIGEQAVSANGLCHQRVAETTDPVGLAYDGEGLLYVADAGEGAILSLPAGSLAPHLTQRVMDAQGVSSIALYKVASSQAWRSVAASASALASALAAAVVAALA